jgi:hypothetical protein
MIINLDEHLKKNLFNNLNLEQSYYWLAIESMASWWIEWRFDSKTLK